MENTPVHKKPLRTIAMHPGTREIGYAVLEATELLHFGVHTFPHRLSARQLLLHGQRFLAGLITAFEPHLFVLERTFFAKSTRSPLLHVFVEDMQRYATAHHLRVAAYAPATVKKAITGHHAATKREVAETLLQWYPYLVKYLDTDLRSREKYWENMFDAVAIGLTGYEKCLKERRRGAGASAMP